MVEEGYNTKLISALEYMRIDEEKMADFDFIRENIQRIIREAGPATYYITQGYICRNADGEIDNLRRTGEATTSVSVLPLMQMKFKSGQILTDFMIMIRGLWKTPRKLTSSLLMKLLS